MRAVHCSMPPKNYSPQWWLSCHPHHQQHSMGVSPLPGLLEANRNIFIQEAQDFTNCHVTITNQTSRSPFHTWREIERQNLPVYKPRMLDCWSYSSTVSALISSCGHADPIVPMWIIFLFPPALNQRFKHDRLYVSQDRKSQRFPKICIISYYLLHNVILMAKVIEKIVWHLI